MQVMDVSEISSWGSSETPRTHNRQVGGGGECALGVNDDRSMINEENEFPNLQERPGSFDGWQQQHDLFSLKSLFIDFCMFQFELEA